MRRLRKAAQKIAAWVRQTRVERRYPEIAMLRKAEAEARRKHRSTKPFQEARVAMVNAALRVETGVKNV